MKRLTLGGVLAALALFPAGALAGMPRATVFSVDKRHHTVQLVDAGHLVHAYRYHGRLPRLGLGDKVSFRRSGRTISHVTRTARASGTVSFFAQVVRSSSGRVQLRLTDGNTFSLSSKQVSAKRAAHAAAVTTAASPRATAAPVTVLIDGLTPGATVLISETVDAQGHWTITITLPPSATSGGTVAQGGDPSADDQVAEGTILQVSNSSLAISTSSGARSFAVDPASGLTDGFHVGDVVDVTYAQQADGSLSVDDIEYVEDDASGVVTAVSDGSITIADAPGGPPQTISADPTLGLFTGVVPGDQVDVTYHHSAAGPVADAVDDQSWDS
ncbi:MAG: hypothetical protein ACXVRW_11555 [Solirubrobacteraceae bacterium]